MLKTIERLHRFGNTTYKEMEGVENSENMVGPDLGVGMNQ
jgi:hypothetical protein